MNEGEPSFLRMLKYGDEEEECFVKRGPYTYHENMGT